MAEEKHELPPPIVTQLPSSIMIDLGPALARFVMELRQAREAFIPDDEAGRPAVVRSLRSVLRFLELLPCIDAEGLHVPIGHLLKALEQLADGATSPLLKATHKSGRQKDSAGWDAFRGFVVYWLELAAECHEGKTQGARFDAACKAAVRILNSHAIKPTRGDGKLSVRTLRNWREAVAADVGAKTTAGQAVRDWRRNNFLQPPESMPVDERRKALLQILTKLILDSSFGKKPPNPPS